MPTAAEAVKQAILKYERISDEKREFRKIRNSVNWDTFNHIQDFSHKADDQSQEFIPTMSVVLEQLVATVLQALTGRSDEFFSIDERPAPDDIFDKDTQEKILSHFLYHADIISIISEGAKYVGLDGIVTAKVGSHVTTIPRFEAERGIKFLEVEGQTVAKSQRRKPKGDDFKKWSLALDLIPFDDFHFDPTPNPGDKRLFEIHVVERDLHNLIQFAEDTGIYDIAVVKKIQEGFIRNEEKSRKNRQADEPEVGQGLSFRKTVTVKECWGDIIDETGKVLEKNVVCAIANDEFLIRPPEKNPRFDGSSPFITGELIKHPRSQYAKAIMDGPASLNIAFNELTNLILDGSMSEAQNVNQVNYDALHEPKQIEDGLRPSMTLLTNNQAGGQDVMKSIQTGRVPAGSMQFLQFFRELILESGFSSELKLGSLPQASTKATAIVESQQAIAGVFGGLTRVFEDQWIVPILEKSWVTILMNMSDPHFMNEDLVAAIGAEKAQALQNMKAEDRFSKGTIAGKVKVRGISGFVNRLREFQKLTQLLSVIGQSEVLLASFNKTYSMDKFLGEIVKATGIREDNIRISESEREAKDNVNSLVEAAAQQAGPAEATQPATGPANITESQLPDFEAVG